MACLLVDGSIMEGGGQVLRIAVASAVIQQRPLTINRIRAGRSKPGLKAQHLTALKVIAQICNGKLTGGEMNSCEISITPEVIRGGYYSADTKTAGSVMLILQAALPCALYANAPTSFSLRGGTDADMAPPVDYITHVFAPVAEKFGVEMSMSLAARGFFPAGGGEIEASVKNLSGCLQPVDLVEFGKVTSIGGVCVVSHYPSHLADTVIDAVTSVVRRDLPQARAVPIDVVKEIIPQGRSTGRGLSVVLWAHTSTGAILGSSFLGKIGGRGERGTPAHIVGANAADELVRDCKLGACVDYRMQDQIIILMGLAEGRSSVLCGPLTLHTKTAIEVMQQTTQAKFTVKETEGGLFKVTCEGIGKRRS